MADERWLMITPKQLGVDCDQTSRMVRMGLDLSDAKIGLAPGLHVAAVFSPTEARALAQALVRKADEAEEGLPRA
jgi:hypothetical protein